MSMIDSEKLLEELEKNSIFRKVTNAEGMNAIEIIKSQPPADQWISVTKKLPKRPPDRVDENGQRWLTVDVPVLVTDEVGRVYQAYFIFEGDGGRFFYSNSLETLKVKAWMPLPEPYKGVE